MGIGNLNYEECRKQRMEENKKRLEELNLAHLSRSLSHLPPKTPTPMKKRSRIIQKVLMPVRRSPRRTDSPAPVYTEVNVSRRLDFPRRKAFGVSRVRDLLDRVIASDETRVSALSKAEKFVSKLESDFPILIRGMLPSHVSGGFWLGLPSDFCRRSMPRQDGVMKLIDEEGKESDTVYLARKWGLSGGWKGFAVEHGLVDGDAVVFELISHSVMKVYIIRPDEFIEKVKEEGEMIASVFI